MTRQFFPHLGSCHNQETIHQQHPVDDSPPVLQIPKNVFQVLGLLGDFLVLHSHGLGRRFFLRFGVSWIGLLVGERCCHGLGGDTCWGVNPWKRVFCDNYCWQLHNFVGPRYNWLTTITPVAIIYRLVLFGWFFWGKHLPRGSFVPLGLPLAHQVLTAACGIVICMLSLVCICCFSRFIWAACHSSKCISLISFCEVNKKGKLRKTVLESLFLMCFLFVLAVFWCWFLVKLPGSFAELRSDARHNFYWLLASIKKLGMFIWSEGTLQIVGSTKNGWSNRSI